MKSKLIVMVLLVVFVLASCASIYTPTSTKNIIPAITLTTIPALLTSTPIFYPTPHRPPYPPTPPLKSVLFSYTILPDGGSEIYDCLQGNKQPIFILYDDGKLIIFRDGQYWQSMLSQNEVNSFIKKISGTGLPQSLKVEYGFSQLSFQGKLFYSPKDNYSESPFKKAVDVINQYSPQSLKSYTSEDIILWVLKIDKIESLVETLPKPIPPIKIWDKKLMPLSEYDGYYVVTGKTTSKIMAQFDNFPDYQIFSENNFLYLAAICANISNEYYP